MTESSTTDRKEWVDRLDHLTKDRAGQYVAIEVLDPTYGDEPEAERLPFAYSSYDEKDDVVIIAVGGNSPKYPVVLRHMVWHPTEVDVDMAAGALKVVEKDGTTTIASFFPPLGQT
jgi:hypothetical protein